MPQPVPSWLRVARIVRPQGHRGEVIAEILTDFPERFQGQPTLWLRAPEQPDPLRSVAVESARPHSGRIVLRLAGCTTMEEAEAMRGLELVVPWEQRTPLPDGEIYIAELAGATLIDIATRAVLGMIADVDRDSTEGVLLVVEAQQGHELLVPFVQAYKPCWNAENRTLHMELPRGLLELPDSSQAPSNASSNDMEA